MSSLDDVCVMPLRLGVGVGMQPCGVASTSVLGSSCVFCNSWRVDY